jgi:hypothetical protein
MSEHEGRFFGSVTELQYDVLRYQANLGVQTIIAVLRPNMTMRFENGNKITWHLIEEYEHVWEVAGYEFSTISLDASLGKLGHEDYAKTAQYILSRLRRAR